MSEITRATVQRYILAVNRDANGTNREMGIARKRLLMPATASDAERNAPEIAAKLTACSAMSGIRYWA
ncbi:Uncharacterised protein [Mycobacteroides abscessus subsp. abscessus]|nr:Uncharacterised protein [Mycobacteroides abscessus subsp. abscessus]